MQKKFLSICVLLWMTVSVQAQISIMPKAGLTLSNVSFSDLLEEDLTDGGSEKNSNLGFLVGAAVNIQVSDLFSIQPELNFLQKGFSVAENASTEQEKINFNLNYLELPILAKFSFGPEKLRAYINAGPSIGVGLGGNAKFKSDFGDVSVDIKFGDEPENSQGDEIYFNNSLDFGVQVGGGLGIGLGSGQLVIDLRYGLGLSNLFDEQDGFSGEDVKSKNGVFAASIGYMIPLF